MPRKAVREKRPPFSITRGMGFQMTFENGWTASVQWGPGTHTTNQHEREPERAHLVEWQGRNAEVAAFTRGGHFAKLANGEETIGWQSPEEVLEFLRWVEAR